MMLTCVAGDIGPSRGVRDGIRAGRTNPRTRYVSENRRSQETHSRSQQDGRPHGRVGGSKVGVMFEEDSLKTVRSVDLQFFHL